MKTKKKRRRSVKGKTLKRIIVRVAPKVYDTMLRASKEAECSSIAGYLRWLHNVSYYP